MRDVSSGIWLFACMLLSTAAQAPETMQEVEDRLLENYSRNCNPTLAASQRAGKLLGVCGDHPKATEIEVQIYVHRLSHIDQKEGTFEIEGYFRMWWNDSRLRFNGTKDGGCEDKLHYTVDAGQPPKLWVPDVYFENSRQNHLGLPNDGTLLESYPDGGVFMSQRLRLTVNCAMNLGRLPWDRQICGVNVGVFSETAKQVQLAWTSKNFEGALANLDKQSLSEWYILNASSQVSSRERAGANYSLLKADFILERHSASLEKIIWKSVMFVMISWLGFWIDAHAAPARVTLAILMVLIVVTKMESVAGGLPDVGYHIWLLDFQLGCLIFNVASFVIYVLVNLGLQNADKLNSLKKQAEADRMLADVGFVVGDNFTSEGLHDSEMYRQQPDAQGGEREHRERDLLEEEHKADPQTQTSRASSTFGDVDAVAGALEPLTVTLTECNSLQAPPSLHSPLPVARPQHKTFARKSNEPRPRYQDKTFSRKPLQRAVVPADKGARTWRFALVEWKSHLQDLDLWMRFIFPVAFGIYVGVMYAIHPQYSHTATADIH